MMRRVTPAGTTLRGDLADGPLWVRLDRGQLEAALLNLIVNSIHALDGHGQIVVTAQRLARSGDARGGRSVAVSVSDTGVGMEAAHLARAAEPFYTTKAVGEGTGLGLSSVGAFVRRAGGSLSIDSAPGEGTVVTMRFPEAVAGALDSA